MANALRTAATVVIATLLFITLVAVSPTDAVDVGDTCSCAQVGGGAGQCIRFVSGTAAAGTCAIGTCGASFKCVPDADATHVCLAQAGSGESAACNDEVRPGQTSCSCTMKRVTSGLPSLVPTQTSPRKATPRPTVAPRTPSPTVAPRTPRPTVAPPPKCTTNGDCGANKVCVSGTCEAAGQCTGGKQQVCDDAYTRVTGRANNRAKCCPASSNCVKNGVQAGESTACSTDCGKKCEPFCSLSAIKGVPLCSKV